jgi:uncharacterized membrane protein
MFTKKLIFLSLLTIITALISASWNVITNSAAKQSANCFGKNPQFSIEFYLYAGWINVHLCAVGRELWQDGKKLVQHHRLVRVLFCIKPCQEDC